MHPLDTLADVCLATQRRAAAMDLHSAVRRHALPHHDTMLDRVRAVLSPAGHDATGRPHGVRSAHHG